MSTASSDEFVRGVAYALGTINAGHYMPVACAAVLRTVGISGREALRRAGVASYDIASLSSALRILDSSPKEKKRAVHRGEK